MKIKESVLDTVIMLKLDVVEVLIYGENKKKKKKYQNIYIYTSFFGKSRHIYSRPRQHL